MPKHGSIILYVHGNQKARWDGQPRMATSTLTQLLNYEFFLGDDDDVGIHVLGCRVDVLGTNCNVLPWRSDELK